MLWMRKGYQRVQHGLLSIVQMSVAAGLAYFVALDFLHHTKPFFAPMAAIIMLGLNSGNRLKKGRGTVYWVLAGRGLGRLPDLRHWPRLLAIGISGVYFVVPCHFSIF